MYPNTAVYDRRLGVGYQLNSMNDMRDQNQNSTKWSTLVIEVLNSYSYCMVEGLKSYANTEANIVFFSKKGPLGFIDLTS